MIRPYIREIGESYILLANIDFIRAKTLLSDKFKATEPELLSEPHIDWIQARHPLLQMSLEKHEAERVPEDHSPVRKIVPLDIILTTDKRMLIISGPNAGGKSVCLKTAGLLQYMIQCGLSIPVSENSKAGVFSKIMIDIGDEQSIADDLSTYSSHLLNMKQMLRNANAETMILIDEFGTGTEPHIGGAIAESVLEQLTANGVWGIITTHYQNLKSFAQSHSSVVNGAMLYDRTHMQPLYLLQIGNPGSSFAIEIARKIGIPEEVIAYATNIVGQDYVMSDKYLQDIVRDKMYWENKRRNIHKREKQLEDSIANYEHEMVSFQEERKAVMAQAKEEAKALLQESNAKIENTIREIREAQADKERTREARRKLGEFKEEALNMTEEDDAIARKIAKIKRRQERKLQAKKHQGQPNGLGALVGALGQAAANTLAAAATAEKPKKLVAGNYVRIKGQHSVGQIAEVGPRTAKVLFGVMYTTVPLNRLEPAEKPQVDTVSKVSTFISRETRDAMHEKKLNFRPEIDLRGMRADEALTATAYFIDDAIQCEQSRVRILHGTGTGALRTLVRNHLGTVNGVRRFHDEHVQFGGAGITVVELE